MTDLASNPASQNNPAADLKRRTYTVDEAAALLGISRTTAYECVKTGELPSLRFRRRIVIPAHVIESMTRAA